MMVFISACKGTDQDQVNTDKLRSSLKTLGANFEEVEGCYKGVKENSFKVEVNAKIGAGLMDLLLLADNFNQESIMLVYDNNQASLIYPRSSGVDMIGKFQEVESIDGLDAYSVINGKFYSVK